MAILFLAVGGPALILSGTLVVLAAVLGIALWTSMSRQRAVAVEKRASKPDPTRPVAVAGASERGRLDLAADLRTTGTLVVDGDVVIRSTGVATSRRLTEIDVPTRHVDRFVRGLNRLGVEVAETGETVDTDEGEETLTTVRLDLETLDKGHPASNRDDRLRVRGSATVQAGAVVSCNLDVDGDVAMGEAVVVRGNVTSQGSVTLAADCVVEGELSCAGDLELGLGAVARTIRCGGRVRQSSAPARAGRAKP